MKLIGFSPRSCWASLLRDISGVYETPHVFKASSSLWILETQIVVAPVWSWRVCLCLSAQIRAPSMCGLTSAQDPHTAEPYFWSSDYVPGQSIRSLPPSSQAIAVTLDPFLEDRFVQKAQWSQGPLLSHGSPKIIEALSGLCRQLLLGWERPLHIRHMLLSDCVGWHRETGCRLSAHAMCRCGSLPNVLK